MTQKERLVELAKQYLEVRVQKKVTTVKEDLECLADYLLSNGVIVPPCKVGDKMFAIFEGYITTAQVIALYFDGQGGMFDLNIRTNMETINGFKHIIFKDFTFEDYGKKLFFTVEEAEQALKERQDNGT